MSSRRLARRAPRGRAFKPACNYHDVLRYFSVILMTLPSKLLGLHHAGIFFHIVKFVWRVLRLVVEIERYVRFKCQAAVSQLPEFCWYWYCWRACDCACSCDDDGSLSIVQRELLGFRDIDADTTSILPLVAYVTYGKNICYLRRGPSTYH